MAALDEEAVVSRLIQEDLQATGVAPVIVVLAQEPAQASAAAAAANDAAEISQYFVTSELSQESALLFDATARVAEVGLSRRRVRSAGRPRGATAALTAAANFRGRPSVADAPVPEAEPPPLVRYYPNLGVALGNVTREGLAALRRDDRVSQVTGAPRIGLIRPTTVKAATLRSQLTWGIRRLGIPALWTQGLTGKGVTVGHLDTGVDGRHPTLRNAIGSYAEFDLFGRQIVPDPPPQDSNDHGTHTAGTIAGRPQRNRGIGVAPGAMLASAAVIEGGQVVARVLGGMDWCVGQGVRVLSMSLGLRGSVNDFLPLTQILRARSVLPVFAVGNEGPGTSRSPGNYAESLSVGASDRGNNIADFSSSQRFRRARDPIVPDIVAPGLDVLSAKPGGGYQSMSGSSMATPHIAGLAALLFEANPAATVDQVEAAILDASHLEPGWSPERAGRGVPDARRALKILTA
jgi:subtilisin